VEIWVLHSQFTNSHFCLHTILEMTALNGASVTQNQFFHSCCVHIHPWCAELKSAQSISIDIWPFFFFFAHENQITLHTSSQVNTSHITVTPHQLIPLTAFNWHSYRLSNVTPTASATHYGNTNAWFTRVTGQWILSSCVTYHCVYSKYFQLMHTVW